MEENASTPTDRPAPYDYTDDPDGVTREEVRYKDLYLQLLMAVVLGRRNDSADGRFGVTANSGGLLVSGLAISHKAWEEFWLEQLRGPSPELADAMREGLASLTALQDEVWERREAQDRPNPSPQFLHLRDATLYPSGTPVRIGLWRCPIASIHGWTLGTLSTD